MVELEYKIKAKAKEFGYYACGIINANDFEEFSKHFDDRISQFPHATQLYNRFKTYIYPDKTTDWANSIIVCVKSHNKYKIFNKLDRFIGKSYLFDFRVSSSKDYAVNLEFENFIRSQGLRISRTNYPCRLAAAKSGIGKFRSNNFLYTEQGSMNHILTWAVDKKLEYDKPAKKLNYVCPEGCNKCVKACPTGALSAPYKMDASKCITYLTNFSSAQVSDEQIWDQMGSWLYGCDICQNVCPANANKGTRNEIFTEPIPLEDLMDLENLFLMNEAELLEKVLPRFNYIDKDNLWRWKHNVIRVMANTNPNLYKKYFIKAINDPNEKIRIIAEWALKKVNRLV